MGLASSIAALRDRQDLTSAQASAAFSHLISGTAPDDEIASFLLALKEKGETVSEITAAAQALRAAMTPFDTGSDAIDVCGTGGDNSHSYNISTTVAIVVAACGMPVAKHGNRSVSSRSGSTDVLTELGVRVDASLEILHRCLEDAQICYLAAPQFHPAMRHVAAARKQLATRTIFNLLGPLCNPAGVMRQVMGVYDAALLEPLAQVLAELGSVAAWIVHGDDGMDELSISGVSQVAALADGRITCFTVTPEDAGLSRYPASDLQGGDAAHNAAALRHVLDGEQGAYRDTVLLNAAAALVVAQRADNLAVGAMLAAEAIDSGRAADTLSRWVALSQGENE